MPTITTYLGYKFHTDDDTIKVGQRVEVPIPEVENPVTVPQRVLDYLSQMYGHQKEWSQEPMGKYAATEGLESFPDFILNLREDKLKKFLTKMYGVSATGIRHYSSNPSGNHMPEIRFKCKHEKLAKQIQYLWWRLGIRIRAYNHTQAGWICETSGNAAYVKIRPLMHAARSPKLSKKMKELDMLVPFKFRIDEFPMDDRVVEVEPDGE